jgi:adenylate kinase family enzyme
VAAPREVRSRSERDGTSPRIVIVGMTGSGKTTLARELAKRLQIPHVELDSLYWGPNWTPVPVDQFRAKISAALAGDGWIADGNYTAHLDLIWSRATMLVWLDYPLPLTMWRLWSRSVRRGIKRELLWNGNKERFWIYFFSRESLLLWALQTRKRRRATYPALLQRPEYQHIEVSRLRSPAETAAWLATIPAKRLLLRTRQTVSFAASTELCMKRGTSSGNLTQNISNRSTV